MIHDVGSTDIGNIGMDGLALDQAIDLFNYYQRLTAKAGDEIIQLTRHKVPNPMPANPAGEIISDIGTALKAWTSSKVIADKDGVLAGKPFTVVGHSLGGHLAMLLGRMAGNQATAVYTYNAPGFDSYADAGIHIKKTELFFYQLAKTYNDLGLSSPMDQAFNTGKMHNYTLLGDGTAADVISKVGTVPGGAEKVFAEVHNPADAHRIVTFADALAVQAA